MPPLIAHILRSSRDTLDIYWMLVRLTVPIMIGVEALSRLGAVTAIAPLFGPVMRLVGLPPELGLAWLSGLLTGVWGAVPLIFALVPAASLTQADVTVFSALILFAHALPVEQGIIGKAGPGLTITAALRIVGGLVYAFILHRICQATGWLSGPVTPAWLPAPAQPGWPAFFAALAATMAWMLVILFALTWALAVLRATGILARLMSALGPVLRLGGIRGEAQHLTAIGLFLGISYGGGLLIRKARSGKLPARQVFLSCVFMGFAHSIIEDTLIVIAIGADPVGVLAGRLVFAVAATAGVASLIAAMPDRRFFRWFFRRAPAPAPHDDLSSG